jgi:hypothetical protein
MDWIPVKYSYVYGERDPNDFLHCPESSCLFTLVCHNMVIDERQARNQQEVYEKLGMK